jgi:hypothetical protein
MPVLDRFMDGEAMAEMDEEVADLGMGDRGNTFGGGAGAAFWT